MGRLGRPAARDRLSTDVDLARFDPADAATVSGWARTPEEVRAWCSEPSAPVPPARIAAWGEPDDVRAFAGRVDGALVAYGELWLDDEEVELARLVVAPEHRGRGRGRRLVLALTERAREHAAAVCLRVRPEHAVARRCYERAGYRRATPEQERAWNEGQPTAYVWMLAGPEPPSG